MRGEINIDRLPVQTVNNQVLVKVHDIFSGFTTKSGIDLVNLTDEESWADSKQFNISEFAIRKGEVILVPEKLSQGSFDYKTFIEIEPGDSVYWSVISFKDHTPLVYNGDKYLLVDYYELLVMSRNDLIQPINGYGLFKAVSKEEKLLAYTRQVKKTDEWILYMKPQKNVVYDKPEKNASTHWEVGDKVRLLVGSSPYKIEGDIYRTLGEELYACPMSYIICTV